MIKSKPLIKEDIISTIRKDNHTIGCELEVYAQTLRYRGYEQEADELDEIASRIK